MIVHFAVTTLIALFAIKTHHCNHTAIGLSHKTLHPLSGKCITRGTKLHALPGNPRGVTNTVVAQRRDRYLKAIVFLDFCRSFAKGLVQSKIAHGPL